MYPFVERELSPSAAGLAFLGCAQDTDSLHGTQGQLLALRCV